VATKFKALAWFDRDFAPLGYALIRGGSGHFKIVDPAGRYVGTIAATLNGGKRGPRNAQATLRRHEAGRRDLVAAI